MVSCPSLPALPKETSRVRRAAHSALPQTLTVNVDYIYGFVAWDAKDGFPKAQSSMNIIETVLNFYYLYLVHQDRSLSALSLAPVVGLVAVVMTASKTVLYLFNDMFCGPSGWCKTGHNDWFTFIFLWVLPNTPWIYIPSWIAYKLGKEIQHGLHVAAKVSQGSAKGAAARKSKSVTAKAQ